MISAIALIGALAATVWIPRLLIPPRVRLIVWIAHPLPSNRLLPSAAFAENSLDHALIHGVRVSEGFSTRRFGELLAIRLGARIRWIKERSPLITTRLSCQGKLVWIVSQAPRRKGRFQIREQDGVLLLLPRCR
ncbi:MAG: hypothetical protein ACYCS1_03665 [Gammaproteobacteria bacterium]